MTSKQFTSYGVLLSGGLDSAILAGHLAQVGHRVQPFYICTDLQWQDEELAAARSFLQELDSPQIEELVTLELPVRDLYRHHWSTSGVQVPDEKSPDEAVFLPGRNALLLIKAAIWCQLHGIDRLAIAALGTSPFHDARAEFFNDFQKALNCGDLAPIMLERTFSAKTKREVMDLGRGMPLELTWSCIAPRDGLQCGHCNKCAERKAAFRIAEIDDRTAYAMSAKTRPMTR